MAAKFTDALKNAKSGIVESQEIDQSHRENLQWAIQAAGRYKRLNQEPATCPNDAAYFLYCEAKNNPKEFLTKVTQVESKAAGNEGSIRRASQEAIEEINKILTKAGVDADAISAPRSEGTGSES